MAPAIVSGAAVPGQATYHRDGVYGREMSEPTNSPDQPRRLSRRRFLQTGAAAAGSLYLGGLATGQASAAARKSAAAGVDFGEMNLVIFLTDQETYHDTIFPKGWLEKNLPGYAQLKRHGMTFENAYTNTCACSPARSTIMTGQYPAQHGVKYVLEHDLWGPNYPQVDMLPADKMPNIASVMAAAGYYTVYKGKWHCSKYPPATAPTLPQPPEQQNDPAYPPEVNRADYPPSPITGSDPVDMLVPYGWNRWDAPDAGANQAIAQMGGGIANHDGRIMASRGPVEMGDEGVLEFIRNWPEIQKTLPPGQRKFCLVVSLVNPHDVLAYPRRYVAGGYSQAWLQGDMELPDTVAERLVTKPRAQAIFKALVAGGTGPLQGDKKKLNYLNFYANLMKASDNFLTNILAAMRAVGYDADKPANSQFGLLGQTLVIRTADHGEMGLTNGGQRQKWFNMYEPTINIPLIFSNPIAWPKPVSSKALVSHVDLLPTLASLVGAPAPARAPWPGKDYSSLLRNPKGRPVQDYIVFTNDDFQAAAANYFVPPPNHILGIREKRWKLAKYYDLNNQVAPEYEMYDLLRDPQETTNLAYKRYRRNAIQERNFRRLKAKLDALQKTLLQPLPSTPQPVGMPPPGWGNITKISQIGRGWTGG